MVDRYRLAGYLRTDSMTRAMLRVPKEEFMDPSLISYAYADQPFPIPGDGRQTISAARADLPKTSRERPHLRRRIR